MPPFYERSDFRELDREWRQRLAELGFRDIESPGGQYLANGISSDGNGGSVGLLHLDGPELESVASRHRGLVDTNNDLFGRARDVLEQPEFWEGLPETCRRWWALIVLGDWEPKAAARQVGVSERCERRWLVELRARLERRRR